MGVTVHQLSRTDARRLAVRAQLLDRNRPTGLLDLARKLGVIQLDQTAAVAPSADLIAWSRLGSTYDPEELSAALDGGDLIELNGLARPREDLPLFYARMAAWPGSGELRDWQEDNRDWVEANDACRRDILERLRSDGPLTSAELPDTCELPWRSSGWSNNQNVIRMLDFMAARGEVAVAGRQGLATAGGIWRRGYIRTSRRFQPMRPSGSATNGGCARRASPAPRQPNIRSSPTAWVMRANPLWWKASTGAGGSTRHCSSSRSRGGLRCCPRWTG